MSGALNYFEEEEGTKMKVLFVNVLLLCSLYGLTSGCLNMADQVSTLLIFIIVTICALGVYLGSLVWIIDETNCCFGSCVEPLASSQTQAEVQHEEHVQTNISKGRENSTWTECVYINVNKLN
ncbi:hypothetical protein ATANTOWER_012755 [Ataeniobius toweri]|uniref:Uncharacterized protein n=1 Tax=Ataeniobius toweri TaxID=208326 RepID=A0ABU7BIE5_9TELE|nr:hypothetical protein [Ataeniobius toweri]